MVFARGLAVGIAFAWGAVAAPAMAAEAAEARADAAIQYEIDVSGAEAVGENGVQALLESSLRIYRLQEEGAASIARLKRRAEDDIAAVQKILRSEGYFEGEAEIAVEAATPQKARVRLSIAPGRPFKLVAHDLEVASPPLRGEVIAARDLGSPIGDRAQARGILTAEAAAVARLRRNGYPYAAFASRTAEADFQRAELRVRTVIDAGAYALFGPLVIQGADGVDKAYLASYRDWVEGRPFDEEALGAYQRAISQTGLFSVATVSKPEAPGGAGRAPLNLPVTLRVERAPERTVGLGARYATDSGPEARIAFEHRNLAGANEQLSAVLEGGAEDQSLKLELRKPQFLQPGQDIVAGAELRRDLGDAFDETAASLSIGLERALGKRLGGEARAGFGLLGEASLIEDAALATANANEQTAYLLGAPAFLSIDARNDPLDPSAGWRFRAAATPFIGVVEGASTQFLTLDASGSVYQALDEEARWVLAARARLGAILSDDLAGVPAPRRLYSGGGGSVRGYASQFVGPLDASGDPIGGRSVAELGGELRWRIIDPVGLVLFAEAGAVSTDLGSVLDEDLQIGAGPGLRYYSPIGPVGVDIAAPLDPRPEDAPFQLYFFIGQAF